jgi:hypothetical protein
MSSLLQKLEKIDEVNKGFVAQLLKEYEEKTKAKVKLKKAENVLQTRVSFKGVGSKVCMRPKDIQRFLSETLIKDIQRLSTGRLKSLAIEILETCIAVDPARKFLYRKKENIILCEDDRYKLEGLIVNMAI